MDNPYFQEARQTIARLELLAFAAETDTQREAVKKELHRAKMILNSAFPYSSPAEQDQIIHMQDLLNDLYDYDLYQ
ncbi:DUF3813 domain-containing protein [Halalkalibacter krulwichiae]|uniref:Uncharacterized protein n=1 Tax=Halalkalibacter krulwichiae TaxID=199441 RepID=A0A1X9MHB2_9BACI|nr:DUF3813 domain-containing protein [Halalkalibacter krulwichiae]ARK31513.1 hypothetical protein BkAM31D_17630 [Halalkalibacter krulwichiae]